jgi:hypothetical protein
LMFMYQWNWTAGNRGFASHALKMKIIENINSRNSICYGLASIKEELTWHVLKGMMQGWVKNKLPMKRNMYGTRNQNLKFDVIEGNVWQDWERDFGADLRSFKSKHWYILSF